MIIINCRFLTQQLTGVQRFAIEICLRLKEQHGDSIIFVAPKNILNHEVAEKLNVLRFGLNKGHIWEQIDLPFFLFGKRDAILVNLTNTAPVFFRNKIITIHDCAFYRFPETFSKAFVKFYNFLIPNIIKRSKHIFTVSKFSKEELIHIYQPKQEITVIYNSVSTEFTQKNAKNADDQPFMLAVSSLNNRKNFKRVLEAFKHSGIDKNVRLKIIGDFTSSHFSKIEGLNENSENIDFLGRVSDDELIEFYSNAIAFIYPSLYEGFGIPPLEAQACGCPVLLSNVSSLPEIFEDSALYCDPLSVQDIANKMNMMQDRKLREQLVSSGELNIKRFSWDYSAEIIFDTINKFVKN